MKTVTFILCFPFAAFLCMIQSVGENKICNSPSDHDCWTGRKLVLRHSPPVQTMRIFSLLPCFYMFPSDRRRFGSPPLSSPVSLFPDPRRRRRRTLHPGGGLGSGGGGAYHPGRRSRSRHRPLLPAPRVPSYSSHTLHCVSGWPDVNT